MKQLTHSNDLHYKLILNYKEVGDDVYSFKAKDKVECDKDDCEEYFVKKKVLDKDILSSLKYALFQKEEIEKLSDAKHKEK